MVRVVYIAGYGRSGSTLLGRLLARSPSVVSLGEVARLFLVTRQEGSPCGCGVPIGRCRVWGPVLERFAGVPYRDLWRTQREHEALRFWSGRLRGTRGRATDSYLEMTGTILEGVRNGFGLENLVLVDGSKTAFGAALRPLRLAEHPGVDLRVVHLVRDSRGVLNSMKLGLNRDLEVGAARTAPFARSRALAGWLSANAAAERARDAVGIERSVRIRYEDLVRDAGGEVARLAAFIGAGPGRDGSVGEAHEIAANRMKHGPLVDEQADETWRTELAPWEVRLAQRVTGRMLSRYGYLDR